jgi:hypothetical protein
MRPIGGQPANWRLVGWPEKRTANWQTGYWPTGQRRSRHVCSGQLTSDQLAVGLFSGQPTSSQLTSWPARLEPKRIFPYLHSLSPVSPGDPDERSTTQT